MTEPKYLSVLHEVESKYGSISNAPPEEVARVQKATGFKKNTNVRGLYTRGRQWKRFLSETDTEKLTASQILRLAQKDEELSANNTRRIDISNLYTQMRKYDVKYKKIE